MRWFLPLKQRGFDNQIKAYIKSFELKVKLQVFIQKKCTNWLIFPKN
ncbi:hypothetical protein C789_473 [Microcystis aeruginosa FACHB-905 = DIANCHI905]|uniref:Uncharacterized protein n=1 Tax=Microcystis aeruginosa PCC 7806SL TaxID=1903187 RepID=A0AB33BWY4_MICA7|nr:hypothetical protein BH695_1631 [Microcystis aeruginosa PCC 7806SL]ELS49754.1 hypothetical protein C789_473 [Microcystis aeruginosa FACHB-905 = DIANCHI905]